MADPDYKSVVSFVLEKLKDEPVERRIFLYRSLATMCADRAICAKCCALADDLEQAELRHGYLALDVASLSAPTKHKKSNNNGTTKS